MIGCSTGPSGSGNIACVLPTTIRWVPTRGKIRISSPISTRIRSTSGECFSAATG